MSQYVVTGSCALLTTISPLNGESYKTLLYRGSLVPDSATEAEIAHNLSVGLIGPVDAIGGGDVVELLEPHTPEVELEEPAADADVDEWRAFAIASGATEEEVADLDLEQLIEQYSAPSTPASNPEEPAKNASTDEWRAFAIASGAQAEDVADLKRDELVELYGTPA